jgi:thiol:disulfide interchange protein
LFKVDATEDSPALDELKIRFHVLGLPTLIFFDEKKIERTDLTLTGFEDADHFVKRMSSAL